MSELLQSGLHPDADHLSAFVERALPAGERERTLAHLAVCPQCRAVVALSLPPVDESVNPLPEASRGRWLSGWNLAWPTAVALAATILFTIYVHRAATTRSAPAQMAVSQHSAPAAQPSRASEPAPSRSANPQPTGRTEGNGGASTQQNGTQEEKPRTIALLPISGRNLTALATPPAAPGEARKPANILMVTQKEAPAETVAPQAAFGVAGSIGQSGGTAQAPMASADFLSNRKIVISSGIAPKVKAAAQSSATLSLPASGTSSGTALVTVADAAVTAPSKAAGAAKAQAKELVQPVLQSQPPSHRLPSRLPVVSIAAHERLVLAIDAQNAVFLSNNAGKRWKAVRAPWTGRAVKAALISSETGRGWNSGAIQAGAAGALFSANAPVAEKADGSLAGVVADATGAAIPGASVIVDSSATHAARTVKTDSSGRYVVSGLAPGAYEVEAAAPGFRKQKLSAVTVAANRESAANLFLSVGAVSQAVTVSASQVEIETTRPPAGEIASSAKTAAKPAASATPPPVFEITTDSGERWTSADGLTWTRK
jgi:hypothetical protein